MNNAFAATRDGQWARPLASTGPVACDELLCGQHRAFEADRSIPQRLAGLFYMGLASWLIIGAAGAVILR